MRKTPLLALLLLASACSDLHAQGQPPAPDPVLSAPAIRIVLGQTAVPLNGPWKFHIGDNPQWAQPTFDDSQWETVDLTSPVRNVDPASSYALEVPGTGVPGWTTKGHPGYWGYAWYRIRVQTAAPSGARLALAGPVAVDDGYQVFDNGVLLGGVGKFSGHQQRPVTYYNLHPEMFLLPQPETKGADPAVQVLAFRVWMGPNELTAGSKPGGIRFAPWLGDSGMIAALVQVARQEIIRESALESIVAVLFFLLAIVAGSLILFDRSDPVYLWLAAVLLITALDRANQVVVARTVLEDQLTFGLIQTVLLVTLVMAGWVMVWWVWFRLREPAWMPKAIAGLTLICMGCQALSFDNFFPTVPLGVSAAFHIAAISIRVVLALLLVSIVIWGIRKRGREGWLVLPAVALFAGAIFFSVIPFLNHHAGWNPFHMRVTLPDIAHTALAAVIFVLLLRRLQLSMRRQRELALDVMQAQEVQQVLIPEELPQVPGLAIESEYRPALQVGGDFFQILPHPTDGSVLLVVGDVTGKGLQAGMLVALIVGAIRTAADRDFDPLHMLQTLNQRLCGRGHAHATCLALRIDPDGSASLANAGHLPPYINGRMMAMEGALPLGLIDDAEFSVLHFRLGPGERLMLLSDGVAEAQDKRGRLFGFERIDTLLQQPISAAELATAAQKFGQEDDISVLSVTRVANIKAVVA